MAMTNVDASLPEMSVGRLRVRILDVDGLASYTTGGQNITAASLGLSRILKVNVQASDNAGHLVMARKAAKKSVSSFKLVWIVVGTGAEVANAVDLSGRFTTIEVWGY